MGGSSGGNWDRFRGWTEGIYWYYMKLFTTRPPRPLAAVAMPSQDHASGEGRQQQKPPGCCSSPAERSHSPLQLFLLPMHGAIALILLQPLTLERRPKTDVQRTLSSLAGVR